jgi:hypothetical protein
MSTRDIIEAATPGPWRYCGAGAWEHTRCDAEQPYPSEDPRLGGASDADARFIATFDPEHVALMEAVCDAAKRNDDELTTAGAALQAYRKERGL